MSCDHTAASIISESTNMLATGTAMSLVSSVATIVAPKTSEALSDEIATSSPAISALSLPSSAPTVSPIASATTVGSTIPSMGASTTSTTISKPKIDKIKPQMGMNGGRWTEQEHQSFLAGLRLYGREWKKVASKIKTRTSAQIRSHAQKYFAKLARDDEIRKHNGLMPPQQEGASSQSTSSLYGYYSDGGSSATMNSGDDGGDTDSSTSQRSSQHAAVLVDPFAAVGVKAEPSHGIPPFPAVVPGPTSTLAHLYNPAAMAAHHQTKKRSRSISAAETTLVLQPLPASKPVQNQCKRRKIMAKEAGGVELLPSQEELLEKVSPNIRQRFSSLIEAEICALQVLSCYALLQRHDLGRQKQLTPRQNLMSLSTSLPGVTAAGGAPFPAQNSIGLTMIATEQIPPMSSIY